MGDACEKGLDPCPACIKGSADVGNCFKHIIYKQFELALSFCVGINIKR